MEVLPAGIAIFIADLCFGVVMIGIHRFAPADHCLRYWGAGMALLGTGILLVTENAGALNPVKLLLGNFGIILGGICCWWGTQLFYRQRRSRLGGLLAAAFVLSFGLALRFDAGFVPRALLVSGFVLLIVTIWMREVGRGQRGRHTLGSGLILGAGGGLLLVYVIRVFMLLAGMTTNSGRAPDLAQVILLYFAPLACMLLLGAGLMLMYFERIIAENRRLASEDALTGLLNRRAIVAAGERAVAQALERREALTVAILDIDFFKQINDSLGHDAGDEALADFARLLCAHCRQQDLVGRYGGEEFCILFPGMDEGASIAAGQRILAAVREYRLRQAYPLTVSIGMAVMLPQADGGAGWAALIKVADQQLYLAKAGGRDQCRRVVFAAGAAVPQRLQNAGA